MCGHIITQALIHHNRTDAFIIVRQGCVRDDGLAKWTDPGECALVRLCFWYLEALGMSHTHTRMVALFPASCVYQGCKKQVHSYSAVVASPANFTGLCEYIPKRLRMFVCVSERKSASLVANHTGIVMTQCRSIRPQYLAKHTHTVHLYGRHLTEPSLSNYMK